MSPSSRRGGAPRRWGAACAAVLIAGSVLLAGCAAKSPGSHANAPGPGRHGQAQARGGDGGGETDASQAAADSCETRLHNISGLLLMYYAINHQLPQSLEDLAPLAEADTEFQPTCPVTGKPSVYVPGGGLGAAGPNQRLIVYEQTAAHKGLRWVVVIAPPEQVGQPPSTRVIPFSEQRFRSYFRN